VLYLHGARRDLAGSWFRIQRLRDVGFAVLAIDYRGFGRSSGDLPTEAQAYEDAGIGWQHLARRVPQASRRFIYGHSLGGAIAIDLAARLDPDLGAGLITEATFTSVPDVVAASRYGWAPVGFLITQRFETVEKMRRVRLPKLIMHGTADRVVPHTMADRLFEAATEPRRLVKFDGAGHSLAWSSSEPYREAVRGFVQTVLAEVRGKAAAG
jgi:alpha-beta hydrolase superfamily lysophospholipase